MAEATDTLPGLLASLLAADATRPLVTYYDDATGERVELSVKSFDNAVAKTANLLQDELGTDPGEGVCLLLPTHWQTAVWVFAVAACGLRLVDSAAGAEVVVCGPDTMDEAAAAGARNVVALALRPLGGPFAEPLPPGVLDHGAEAPGQPDVFVAAVPVTADLVLFGDEHQQAILERARTQAESLGSPPRLLTDLSPADPASLVEGFLAAVAAGGSVVLVRNADPARQRERAEEERVTASRWES